MSRLSRREDPMTSGASLGNLNERFGHLGVVRFEEAQGLVRAVVASPHMEGEVHLQGAHVARYRPAAERHPVLFVSAKSLYAPGKAIRGGVPLIFPWFGAKADNPSAPQHGFARVAPFAVESVWSEPGGGVTVVLRLAADDGTRRAWPHEFVARYRVTMGDALELGFEVENRSAGPFTYEEALHTYLTVGDIRQATIEGLAGTAFIDKVDGFTRKREGRAPIRLAGETDRVYLDTTATCTVDDPVLGRRLVVDKQGSASTVVWNPWAEKAKGLADLGDDEWSRMVCIETANAADNAVTLAPGARHELRAVVRAEAR
jgi:glucose-6-phosphate 1-epimerase